MTMSNNELWRWLDLNAQALDVGELDAQEILPRLAAADILRIGVDKNHAGLGGSTGDALEAVAQVASHSLTAAFVLWGQRTFIEYLLQSPNHALREKLLPSLLDGRLAGATGLSNAIKFLSGIESLQVQASQQGDELQLDGRLPWVTNLRRQGFVVAAAVEYRHTGKSFIAAIPDNVIGCERSDDLNLLGLQSSNTAALQLRNVTLSTDWIIHADARQFLAAVRPAFLGLQCALSIGLARRALDEIEHCLEGARVVLEAEWRSLSSQLVLEVAALKHGIADQRFIKQPAALFHHRIALAQIALAAVQLELQAKGGKAYLPAHDRGFARRWREAAFVPVVTPSLVQLQTELQRHARGAAA